MREQGHVKKDCPEWGKKGEKPPPYQSKGRIATAFAFTSNTNQTAEEQPELKELAHHMHSLDNHGKEQLFNLIMDEDF